MNTTVYGIAIGNKAPLARSGMRHESVGTITATPFRNLVQCRVTSWSNLSGQARGGIGDLKSSQKEALEDFP